MYTFIYIHVFKNISQHWSKHMAQLVESLPSMREAESSISVLNTSAVMVHALITVPQSVENKAIRSA